MYVPTPGSGNARATNIELRIDAVDVVLMDETPN